jgi:hypothetical protein
MMGTVQGSMGPDARFEMETDAGGTASLTFYDGHSDAREIAWAAPDSNPDDFKWMAQSVAAFHHIPLIVSD